jgi:hypothetical protein
MKPLESSNGERNMRGRGKGDNPAQVGRTLKVQEEETHILPGYRVVGTGLRPPRREPENPSGYVRRKGYKEERGQRGRGKSVSLPMSLKFDGKLESLLC